MNQRLITANVVLTEDSTGILLPQERAKLMASNPDNTLTALLLSPHQEDHVLLQHVFGHTSWNIEHACSLSEATALLRRRQLSVVIAEAELADGTWRDLLEILRGQPGAPLLIVTSRNADDQLWAEVLNLGGYDLLMKPFDRQEVVRVVSLAWRHWKNLRAGFGNRSMMAAS